MTVIKHTTAAEIIKHPTSDLIKKRERKIFDMIRKTKGKKIRRCSFFICQGIDSSEIVLEEV